VQVRIRRDRWWAGVWIALIASISLSATWLQPALFAWANSTPGVDKLAHFLLIGGMSYWIVRGLHGVTLCGVVMHPWRWSAVIVVVVSADELSQLWIATRNFSLLDLAANVGGVLVFSAWAARWRSRGDGSSRPRADPLS